MLLRNESHDLLSVDLLSCYVTTILPDVQLSSFIGLCSELINHEK
jgi:hypothetical protein